MLAFTDVQYTETTARAACVLAHGWSDLSPAAEVTAQLGAIAPYEPGAFYKRELPCLLEVLRLAERHGRVETVVIDGYVWLDGQGAPGLGAHLFDALGRGVPVIGVAKTAFKGSEMAARLERPGTVKPLYVTAAGVSVERAVEQLRLLQGPHRIPTLLGAVDRLARGR